MLIEYQLQQFWHRYAKQLIGLKTTNNQSIVVFDAGKLNQHQGPDFIHAHIKIEEVEWVGNIEVHIRTTDWIRHLHEKDLNYKNIVLHVVWINDSDVYQLSPVLELSKFVSPDLLNIDCYPSQLYNLPCSSFPSRPIPVDEHQQLNQLAMDRLVERKKAILAMLQARQFDYSSVLWRHIFRGFGRSVNADGFEKLFDSLPIHVLRLYAYDRQLLESLLMGQANLLSGSFVDDYPQILFEQYQLLKHRHGLRSIHQQMYFLRLRPRNFPTIRLSQLAAFFHHNMALVKQVLSIDDQKEFMQLFDVQHHPYWDNHYFFDRISLTQRKEIGNGMRQQIIINAIIPFLLAYGEMNFHARSTDKALAWINQIKPERDSIIDSFHAVGFQAKTGFHTQALHELYKSHCLKKNCADCVRGKLIGLA